MTTLRHSDREVSSSNPLPVELPRIGPLQTHFDSSVVATAEYVPGAHKLHFLAASNPNAVDVFIQLFNMAAADVVVGTTPPKQSFLVPASGFLDEKWDEQLPLEFTEVLSYAATTTVTGSGAPATGIVLNLGWRP